MTREEVIERALKYGALELAVESNEDTEARVKATIERAIHMALKVLDFKCA